MAGEVLNTYIIVEQGDKVLFIDKHAAHERLNFDRMKAEGYQPMVQALLEPVVFTPPAEEGAALLAQLPLLGRFGFEAEDFGGGALIVRAAPSDVAAGEIPDVLSELAGRLLTSGSADPGAARDALLHTMACKAATRAAPTRKPQSNLGQFRPTAVRGGLAQAGTAHSLPSLAGAVGENAEETQPRAVSTKFAR